MLKVTQIDQDVIDGWKIESSGLPIRVVNSAQTHGIATVGELRHVPESTLLSYCSLGQVSLTHIREYFALCNRISRGIQTFESAKDVLDIFLDKDELHVLSARYGLYRPDMNASRNYLTLQRIGNQENRTRERVRQVEDIAKSKLLCHLAALCLRPFIEQYTTFINEHNKSVEHSELKALKHDTHFQPFNPCSLLLLLIDLYPGQLISFNDFFSVISREDLEEILRQSLLVLDWQKEIMTADQVARALPPQSAVPHDQDMRKTIDVLLSHHPKVAATIDHRYFLFTRGMHRFFEEVMEGLDVASHYRAITNTANTKLKPPSRKGSGFVLKALNANPQFIRLDRGVYEYKKS